MEEYVSPAMIRLSGDDESVSDAGCAALAVVAIVIGPLWLWY